MDANIEMSRQGWLALKDRALSVAAEGITIADALQPGRPLIYVNEGFERLTGFSPAEALGRNCRFLQGGAADPEKVAQIRQALIEERDCTVEIRNVRKDGTLFWNRLSITPVRDAGGRVTHFIGIQSDVTQRRLAEEALRDTNAKLQAANAILHRELVEAAEIQRAWLPQTLPEAPGYRFAYSFTPCQELGGDSLGVIRLGPHHIGMYLLDVSGHGVAAALLSASIQRWLSPVPEYSCLFTRDDETGAATIASPGEVATAANRRFRSEPESGKFYTLVYGVLDVRDGQFSYVNAGHPPPLLSGDDGAEALPVSPGIPIGVLHDFEYTEKRVRLRKGDRLLLYSDGAMEVLAPDERDFGLERLLAALALQREKAPAAALEDLMRRLRTWQGADALDDDVTLLLLDVTG